MQWRKTRMTGTKMTIEGHLEVAVAMYDGSRLINIVVGLALLVG
jgi:hypothetical protein